MIYQTQGTCSQQIDIEGRDGRITALQFYGGCHGNLQGIARLVIGMPYDEVIARLEGIRCGGKPTSCPDQLVQAVRLLKQQDERRP